MNLVNHLGEEMQHTEVCRSLIAPPRLKGGLVCSDLDGTMYENDLGFLVFLEKLSDPTFWTFSTQTFSELLLPMKYREFIENGRDRKSSEIDLDPVKCLTLLNLARDIVALYDYKRKLMRKSENGLTIESPLLNEFARKMIEFDRIFVKLDKVFAPSFEGQLLLRTRFFAGKNKNAVHRLAENAMSRNSDDNLILDVHDENRMIYDLWGPKVTPNDLEPKYCDRVVKVVEETRFLIDELVRKFGMIPKIITTNLKEIAETVVRRTPEYRGIFHRGDIKGSVLMETGEGLLTAETHGKPVIGEEKVRVVESISREVGASIMVALGDSPFADFGMGIKAMRKGGIFVAVGKEYGPTRAKFERVVREARKEIPDIGKRVLYISYGK